MMRRFFYLCLGFVLVYSAKACQCPATSLSLDECARHEIIFKGRIDSVRACNSNFGVAYFVIDELYKGNIPEHFQILFECGVPCAQQFAAGEEWVIYTRYKQMTNGIMDWCSRSRKYFKIAKEDFYTVNLGNDYDDEVIFLRSNLGTHRALKETKVVSQNRNIRPSTFQTIAALVVSLGGILLFYWLFSKYFHKF
jgi:hypothetical protein